VSRRQGNREQKGGDQSRQEQTRADKSKQEQTRSDCRRHVPMQKNSKELMGEPRLLAMFACRMGMMYILVLAYIKSKYKIIHDEFFSP
jgi:hypothetical protein